MIKMSHHGLSRTRNQNLKDDLMASGLVLILIIYFTIDNHLPLYPWNNLEAADDQTVSTLVGLVPFGFALCALALRLKWGVAAGATWAFVWTLMQMRQWWIPYLFGPTPLHRDFSWFFDHGYAQTLRILPLVEGRPVPDLQHMVLQALSVAVTLALVRASI